VKAEFSGSRLLYGEARVDGDIEMDEGCELTALLVEALRSAGTGMAFGLPGGGPNLDAVGAAMKQGMRFVLAHSETSAVIMAATYGELTGVPGFCITTRGPGAANAVNGVVHALLDRDPLVLLTDCVRKADRSRISHQRIEQQELFSPVTKLTARLGRELAVETIGAVVESSVTVPWGPSHITIDPGAPSAIVRASDRFHLADRSALPGLSEDSSVAAARDIMRSACRPVVLVGVGARFESAAVRGFVEGTGVPVLTTYKARGIVADSSSNSAGTITGGTMESPLIDKADLIIAIGLDPVELIPGQWGYHAPVLSLSSWDHDSTYFTPDVEIIGPLSTTVQALKGCLCDEWDTGVAARHKSAAREMLMVPVEGLAPHDLVSLIRRAAPVDTTVTVDAGAHMLVVVDIWTVEESGQMLISNGAATMGYALPAAVAAALVHPTRTIVCFVGDGGLSMVAGELETIVRLGLNVKVVVFNDSALSLIELKQGPGRGGPEAVRFAPTDFAMVARGYGMPGYSASDTEAVKRIASEMFGGQGPVLLDARVDASGYKQVLEALRGGACSSTR